MNKIISQTLNGNVFKCPTCDQIHFEYKNLNFNFNDDEEYKFFASYFMKLDGEYWENRNVNSHFRRKIMVPIGHENLHLLLNNTELMELKELFSKTLNKSITSMTIFDSCFSNN